MRTAWKLGLAGVLLAAAAPALAEEPVRTEAQVQELTKEQEKTFTKTREQLRKELKLDAAALDPLQAQMREYFRLHGDADHLRATVRFGWENGCKTECTGEMIRAMNHAMVQGVQDREARQLVCDALRDRIRERDRDRLHWTDRQLGDQVWTRTQDRLRDWERDHDRMMREFMDRERQRDMERARDMERMHQGG